MLRTNRLIALYLPVFNEHQIMEGDSDLMLTPENCRHSTYFAYWCSLFDDRRAELSDLLRKA